MGGNAASKFASVTRHSDIKKEKVAVRGWTTTDSPQQFNPVHTTTACDLQPQDSWPDVKSQQLPAEHLPHQLLSRPGRNKAFVRIFCLSAPLLVAPVTLETAVGSCFHLAAIWIVLSPHSNVTFFFCLTGTTCFLSRSGLDLLSDNF